MADLSLIRSPGRPIPRQIGRYRILCELGQGAVGILYLARPAGLGNLQRLFAVKLIHDHLARDAATIDLFLNEARIASRIDHPNVVSVYDVDIEGDRYYLAMDYVSGENLALTLKYTWNRAQWFPLEAAALIVAEAAEGLHAAHELREPQGRLAGVVHRDVAPQNMMVGYDGSVKVMDFGLARAGRDAAATSPAMLGSVPYLSPEQVNGETVDRRSDIFSLGVILWEATVGKRLFKSTSDADTAARVLRMKIPRPSSLRHGYPGRLERIVMRALSRDPDQRHSSARELGEDLRDYLSSRAKRVDATDIERLMKDVFASAFAQRVEMEAKALADVPPEHLDDLPRTDFDPNLGGLEAVAHDLVADLASADPAPERHEPVPEPAPARPVVAGPRPAQRLSRPQPARAHESPPPAPERHAARGSGRSEAAGGGADWSPVEIRSIYDEHGDRETLASLFDAPDHSFADESARTLRGGSAPSRARVEANRASLSGVLSGTAALARSGPSGERSSPGASTRAGPSRALIAHRSVRSAIPPPTLPDMPRPETDGGSRPPDTLATAIGSHAATRAIESEAAAQAADSEAAVQANWFEAPSAPPAIDPGIEFGFYDETPVPGPVPDDEARRAVRGMRNRGPMIAVGIGAAIGVALLIFVLRDPEVPDPREATPPNRPAPMVAAPVAPVPAPAATQAAPTPAPDEQQARGASADQRPKPESAPANIPADSPADKAARVNVAAASPPAASVPRKAGAATVPKAAPPSDTVLVALDVEPPEATVLVDRRKHQGALALPRSGERHVIEVSAPGYETALRTITAREEMKVVIHLKPVQKARAARAKPIEKLKKSDDSVLFDGEDL